MESEVAALAAQMAELGADSQASVYRMSWWNGELLERAMARPRFKTELLRLIDVFPSTTGDLDVVNHVREYLSNSDSPALLAAGAKLAGRVPGGAHLAAVATRNAITRVARQFIIGTDPSTVARALEQYWDNGVGFVADLLGEATFTSVEAGAYAARVNELMRTVGEVAPTWAANQLLDEDDLGTLPRVHVSIKPSALAPLYSPLTADEGLAQAHSELMPILERARDMGACVWLDTEHYDTKDLTLRLFYGLLEEPALADLEVGCVIQAYLKDSLVDLRDVVSRSWRRARPISVRFVKGAYWDTETIEARARGWPVPVYERKAETDANYERCASFLHDHHGEIRAAFASHNVRSLAYAVASARKRGIPDRGYEIQMLYGMAEPMQQAIRRLGLRLRLYTPVGELVPGMSYLVRRLLENTSNESFVRLRFAEGTELDKLLTPPSASLSEDLEPPRRRLPTKASSPRAYDPEPVAEWRRLQVREAFGSAVAQADPAVAGAVKVPAIIGGERVNTARVIESVDPGCPGTVVARSAWCGPPEAEAAISACRQALGPWRRTPARERAAVLFRAAEHMRQQRAHLAAIEVFEAGKPWSDADADVCEAIDYCEFYGREMIRLESGGAVLSPPGERNRLDYRARGVGVVVSPWNFPLAIPTGMVTAAIVTGNTVCLKPAEQTPLVACKLVEALEAGGLPPGVVAFLPGRGEEVGTYLVEHREVSFIAFTGSKETGLTINQAAAHQGPGQRQVKRVVAEMGGKNAIVVDSDADLDQAVPAIVHSAFGFAGQKCSAASRLIVLRSLHDQLLERLIGMTDQLPIGHPRHMQVRVGPVIDADAQAHVQGYLDEASLHGEVVFQRDDVPDSGWFVGPTIVDNVARGSPLDTDEIFGPVLNVCSADDFEHAMAIANETDFGLTAGVMSRRPSHIALAMSELRAGNVYVNRAITGAVVGRQPFGGIGMSGVGSKAGGPDYLRQFTDPVVVSENTVRRGFAPTDEWD